VHARNIQMILKMEYNKKNAVLLHDQDQEPWLTLAVNCEKEPHCILPAINFSPREHITA